MEDLWSYHEVACGEPVVKSDIQNLGRHLMIRLPIEGSQISGRGRSGAELTLIC